VDTSREDPSWLAFLPLYNFHYAVRSGRSLDLHKPFLKGFTAAHSGSNIMIQASDTEAVQWLGADYPYLVQGSADADQISHTLELAASDFGTARWEQALARMEHIRRRTSIERIAVEAIRALLL